MNVARDRIGGHDQGGVERVDVFAGDGAFRMTDQGRDCHFGKSEIVDHTGVLIVGNYGTGKRTVACIVSAMSTQSWPYRPLLGC